MHQKHHPGFKIPRSNKETSFCTFKVFALHFTVPIFISLKDSHTVLVKKSRFALESGPSSRSHSFTAKLQIIPPHVVGEAASQAHYVLSKSIWEERGRGALFWNVGADEYLRGITEVSTAGE